MPGLFHATGHEGAGIGLAPATAVELITALIDGARPPVDATPFTPARRPGRFGSFRRGAVMGRDTEEVCVKSG